jgi:integrase
MGMRAYDRLTDRTVKAAKPGAYCDGRGLWLHVSESGARKWILRFSFDRRVHEMGLGNAADVWLADARVKAADARRLAASGVNPIVARREARAVETAKTFGECAGALIKSKRPEWRSEKHAWQWVTTLEEYARPLWHMPVAEIGTTDVLRVLTPLWQRVPETASRLRARVEAVLGYARAHNWRSGDNPAAWTNHLEFILPKRTRLERKHLKAMPYAEVPSFIARLGDIESVAARALEFTILTAARSGEALGARWAEIDLAAKIWTVPAERTKSGRVHVIPLSDAAMAILEKLARNAFVFPGKRGKPLSPTSMTTVLLKVKVEATVHGFRSSFRDYIGDRTTFDREAVEMCLSHRVGSQVEQAYRRSTSIERRREIMAIWAAFCIGDNVIPIRAQA